MVRERSVRLILGFGYALFFAGVLGDAVTGGLGASTHRFEPRVLVWSAVMVTGLGLMAVGWTLRTRRESPLLARMFPWVLLAVAVALLATLPFVYHPAR